MLFHANVTEATKDQIQIEAWWTSGMVRSMIVLLVVNSLLTPETVVTDEANQPGWRSYRPTMKPLETR